MTFSQEARKAAARAVAALSDDALIAAQEAILDEVDAHTRLGRPVSAAKVLRAAFAAQAEERRGP